MSEQFKVGDVVVLKSSPDTKMTVYAVQQSAGVLNIKTQWFDTEHKLHGLEFPSVVLSKIGRR